MWQYRHTSEMYHNALESRPYYAVSYNDDDIYHYGVLGMKWGVRKQRESSGVGRGNGRRKLTAKQKRIIRNVAIGAGTAALIGGGAFALSRTPAGQRALAGIRRNQQAKRAIKGMSEGELRLMRGRVTTPTDLKAINKALPKARRSGIKNTVNNMATGELRSLRYNKGASADLRKAATKEFRARGNSGWNQFNSKLGWNKAYSTARDSVKNTAAGRNFNSRKAAYNRAVTVGNNIRTAAVGAGIVGAGTGAGVAAYNANKKRKRNS